VAINKTPGSITSQGLALESVHIHLHSSHMQSAEGLGFLKHILEMHQSLKLKASLQFGGWHDEMFQKTRSNSNAEYILPLQEGDELQPSFFKNLCKILASPQLAKAYIFGYIAEGKEVHCGPLSFENHFLFDYICKFPCVFRRDVVVDKRDSKDVIFSHSFSLRTEHLISFKLSGELVETIPFVALKSETRPPYYSTWVIKRDELKSRIETISPKINTSARLVIENFYEHLNRNRLN